MPRPRKVRRQRRKARRKARRDKRRIRVSPVERGGQDIGDVRPFPDRKRPAPRQPVGDRPQSPGGAPKRPAPRRPIHLPDKPSPKKGLPKKKLPRAFGRKTKSNMRGGPPQEGFRHLGHFATGRKKTLRLS